MKKVEFIPDSKLLGKYTFTGRPMHIGNYFSHTHIGCEVLKITKDEQRFGYIVWYKKRSKNENNS
jgi:negative regulator of sigma E activity